MPKTIYREVGRRHTSVPRRASVSAPAGGFTSLLAKLGLASEKLNRSRPRRSR